MESFILVDREDGPTGKDADWKVRIQLVERFRENGLDPASDCLVTFDLPEGIPYRVDCY